MTDAVVMGIVLGFVIGFCLGSVVEFLRRGF